MASSIASSSLRNSARLSLKANMKRMPGSGKVLLAGTETTPNEDSLKFIPGVQVMGEGTAEFLDTRSALVSPLAIRLMGVEGVTGVFYGPDFVTVSKDSENTWAVVKPEIYSILMEHFSSGQPLFRSQEDREAAGPQDTRILDTDSETVAMIKELLETRVRPAIMEDGGDIEYRGFDESDGIVKVKLKGSCRGCDSSTVTLKSGIERMLMHYIPEVKSVEQILDQEEEVALSEFEKLENKLSQNGKKDSDQSASSSEQMVYVNSKKFACQSCIKGHRSSSCHHTDRPLFEIKKKGRPVSQCDKCRELRQSKRFHSKCTCTPKSDPASRGEVLASTTSKSRRFIPIVPALPNGLRDVFASSQVPTSLPPDARQRVDTLLNPCTCKSVWKCNCQAVQLSSPTDKSATESTGDLATLAHVATMSCCDSSTNCLAPSLPSGLARRNNPRTPHQGSNKRAKHHHDHNHTKHRQTPSPALELPPIQTSSESLPLLPNEVPDFGFMPPISTITSLAGSGCTCGVECACPGCIEHRGPKHAATDLDDCTDGHCASCIDNQSGIALPTSSSPFSSASAASSSTSSSVDFINKSASLNRFFARAAALPPPPPRMGNGVQLDPREIGSGPVNASPVNLPKLECCGGSCSCPNGRCGCGSSCGGCCADMDAPSPPDESQVIFGASPAVTPGSAVESVVAPQSTVNTAPAPQRSCCAGKST
ncbi:hypothetical protein NP233_g534 [Leucocoprinus birnbaumii]|uniref:Copper-fist domain-containing protein n=1 Tax=Leucocoprinus birnbaumii TaxID=56174 RepID=A0AAD5W251_9AGAR|nr:hypothetical protein NP233_g534 [Leucocoprinus birnbaumii]